MEVGVKAQYKQNQNAYDAMWKKVKETAQVPAMYTEDLKEVYTAALTGRYGEGGSKAMVALIKEHNPDLDSAVYTQVQRVIESGRDDFAQSQQMLLDRKRAYETYLDSMPQGTLARMLGFPRIDLSDYGIVTSERTDAAFSSGKDEPLQLRP